MKSYESLKTAKGELVFPRDEHPKCLYSSK